MRKKYTFALKLAKTMKKTLVLLLTISGFVSNAQTENIYNTDGTLTKNRIMTMKGNNLTFQAENSEVLIDGVSGNVGIGTSTPNAKLEIPALVDGQNFVDFSDGFKKSLLLNIGAYRDEYFRLLTFADMPVSNVRPQAETWFSIEDRKDANRLRHYAKTGGESFFLISDNRQKAVFKVAESTVNDCNYNHITFPETNTRMIIGASYEATPERDSYKLIVKNGTCASPSAPATGNALIEGNLVSMGKVGVGVTALNRGKLEIAGPLDNKVYANTEEATQDGRMLNVGALVGGTDPGSAGNRLLTFLDRAKSNVFPQAHTFFAIEDRNDANRLRHQAYTGGSSHFLLQDKTQSQVFSVYEDGTNAFFDLAKPGSFLTVGGTAVWPVAHNFWVKTGTSKFNSDVFMDTNLGIGTATFLDATDNKTYRLSVKGKIRAEEIKVYNTWADYVFEKEYKLRPLAEVETFINENKHLPNVPSAKEVTEKGLELGEMARIQQEKIEELTLYLIQQNKEIQELKAQMKALLEKK